MIFFNNLGEFALRAMYEGYDNEQLSESLRKGVITYICKLNKNGYVIKNWIPISLLNEIYKLASAYITAR